MSRRAPITLDTANQWARGYELALEREQTLTAERNRILKVLKEICDLSELTAPEARMNALMRIYELAATALEEADDE